MANFEDRNRDSAKNDPNRKNDEFEPRPERRSPGQEEGSESREGQRQGLEYPGEGVSQHYPSAGQQTGQEDNPPSGEEAGTDDDEAK